MVIDGTVPVGAGMSSSAALECAVCKTLDVLFDLGLTQHEIILIVQAAEHEFAGVSCGIMDPFVSVRGKKDHALLLDCRSLDYEEVPLDLKGYRFVLLNSNVKHSLASSAYNQRREECSIGVRQIQRHLPGVQSMRDVTKEMLVEYIRDPLIHRRCRYVIEENERVRRAVACLKAGNIHGLGQQLFLSHDGLSLDYDVSSPELDWLVSSVRHRSYVAGARMMGGGFGGCTINLVREKFTEKLITELTETYERFIGLTLTAYAVKISDGTRVLTEKISA
jgi:galactokinase